MIINELPYVILRSLALTAAIEMLVGFLLGIRRGKDFLNILLVNMITNPFVVIVPVLIQIAFGLFYRNLVFYLLEIAVFVAEAFLYKKVLIFDRIPCFVLSFALNLCSFGIGELVYYLL